MNSSTRIAFRSLGRQAQPVRGRQALRFRRAFASEADAAASRSSGSSSASSASGASSTGAVVGGVAGGSLVLTLAYGWYHFSGAKTAVRSVKQAENYYNTAAKKIQEKTPEPNEALQWLRETAMTYATFIPGARGYVDTAFADLDKIKERHGDEVDKIVSDTYEELKQTTKHKGASLDGVYEAWKILEYSLRRIAGLAEDVAEDLLDNHPQLKEKVGGSINELKAMAKQYGPQAQEQVDQTVNQIRSIASKGLNEQSINEARQLVKEKSEMLKKMGEEAFNKGLEQAKPYLDKSPQVKKLVEENAESLKQGNVAVLIPKIKSAVDSGSTDQLESYIKDTAAQVKSSGSRNLGPYLEMIPNAGDVTQKLKQLVDAAQNHGKEAEQLLESTVSEIREVLQRKGQEAEKIVQTSQGQQ